MNRRSDKRREKSAPAPPSASRGGRAPHPHLPHPHLRRPHFVKHHGAALVRDFIVVGLVAALLFVVLAEVVGFVSGRETEARILVQIPEGTCVREIGDMLESAGLVRDADRFVLAARVLGVTESLQAGPYEFGPRYSEMGIMFDIRDGNVAGRSITIPEGYRAEQIAELAEEKLGLDPAEFMSLVMDPELIARLGIHAPTLEGYLHPNSYRVRIDVTPEHFIELMVWETLRLFDEGLAARADSLGMSMHEVLTLASIIEAEAMVDRERARISAVYHNRLEHGWRLEADPTVRYALDNYRRRLYNRDLDVDSPYNTYRHTGLPPGPIGNPGAASVRAAVAPIEGSDEFFFVANGDGTHTFTRTYAEHLRAKANARSAREDGEFSLDTGQDG